MELSKAQDVEAGDGTTSVVVIAGALISAAQQLLAKGIHPTTIAETFLQGSKKAEEILKAVALELNLTDRESLLKSAITSLNSKVSILFNFQFGTKYSSRLCLSILACLRLLLWMLLCV